MQGMAAWRTDKQKNAASIFPVESTASTRNQTGGTGFAAEFAIAAKDTYFSTTPGATCA